MEDKENQRIEEQERLRKKDFPEKEDGKECPQCHTINNLEAMFCEECGYEFKEEKKDKKCSKCGTINNLEAKFCEECGCEFIEENNPEQVVEEKKKKNEEKKEVKKTDIPKKVSLQNEELLKMKAYTKKIKQKTKKEPSIKKRFFSFLVG